MLKNKKVSLMVGFLLIILGVLVIFYFVFWKNKEINKNGLTEEQRVAIIQELNSAPVSDQITPKERQEIVQDLTGDLAGSDSLTDDERALILGFLGQ
ncbi:MAG: hypothetical protein ABH951_01815 [Patescibacteria group bacterium]